MPTFNYPLRVIPSSALLPFYGFLIPAGFPSPAQDFLEPAISLDELMSIRAPHTYLMRVQGLSMRDAGILDGDILVVDRSAVPVDGDIVVASVNNEPVVKRIELAWGRIVALRSANPEYQDIEPAEGDLVEVWGVVTSSVRLNRR